MKDVRNIADKISFRLLATNKHPDYEWLVGYLIKELINERERDQIYREPQQEIQ